MSAGDWIWIGIGVAGLIFAYLLALVATGRALGRRSR